MSELMIRARGSFLNEKHDGARRFALWNSRRHSVWYMVTLNGTDWESAAYAPEACYAYALFLGGRYVGMVLGSLAAQALQRLPEPVKPSPFPSNGVHPAAADHYERDAAACRAAAEHHHQRGEYQAAHDCMYAATLYAMRAKGAYKDANV